MSRSTNFAIRVLTLGIMVIGSNSFVLSPILADVARDLGTTPVQVTRAISAFGAATALTSFVFARIGAGRVSPRLLLSLGAAVMAVALAGCALAGSWQALAAWQALVGVTVGVMLPTIYATATAQAPEGQGGQVLGRVIRGWGIALVLGVPASAVVSDLAGWRLVYTLLAAAAALTVLGLARLPVESARIRTGARLSLAQGLAPVGAKPLLLVCLLYMTAFYGLYPFLGTRLAETFGASATVSGIVVLSYGLGFGLASYVMGPVDRAGPGRVFAPILLAIAALYVVLAPATETLAGALVAAFVWGIVNHVGVNLIILLLSRRSEETAPLLMALHTTTTYLSIFLGPALMGLTYTGFGFGAAGILAAVLLVVAAGVAWRVRAML